jgi:hypothetical protein
MQATKTTRMKGPLMKKIALGAIAAGALVATTAVPALAEVDVHVGPRGVGVGVGTRHYHGEHRDYYNYAPGWRNHRHDWDGHRHFDNR